MFATLLLSDFFLQAALRYEPQRWHEPVAVLDADTATILELTSPAQQCGVEPGMTTSQALARCPGLKLAPRLPAQEQILDDTLLELAGSLSPYLEKTGVGICTVDLKTSRVPDFQKWGDAVLQKLRGLQLRTQLGVAANPDLALLAARTAAPLLVVESALDLPLAALDPPPPLVEILQQWGVHHLADFTRLPKAQIASRLGVDGVRLWEKAAGQSERLLRLVRPPETYAEIYEFEREIETLDPLLFILRRQLEQLSLRLAGSYRVAQEITLRLPLSNGEKYERVFRVPEPTPRIEPLFRMLDTHLEKLQLEHGPVALHLSIQPSVAHPEQFQLFENALRDPNRFAESIGRLCALLGPDRVGMPQRKATRRADQFVLETPDFSRPVTTKTSSEIGLPLRRYRPSLSAQVHVREQRPLYVVSPQAHGEVRDALGPYRSSGDWWEDDAWSSEEWDVEMARGGLYRLARHPAGWLIEGCYD